LPFISFQQPSNPSTTLIIKMPALISKPLKPFTWNNNKFQINQAFKDEMQERETSEIVVVACVGEARVGKVLAEITYPNTNLTL
jgi:hypothetical protein